LVHAVFPDGKRIRLQAGRDPRKINVYTLITIITDETDAKAQGIEYGKGTFPWAASGRALALNRDDGFTKILFDKQTHRIIGAGIVGTNAGDLIAEVALAIEMGADAADIGLTIHAHPTLSETVAFAAEAFEGTLTDLYIPKR